MANIKVICGGDNSLNNLPNIDKCSCRKSGCGIEAKEIHLTSIEIIIRTNQSEMHLRVICQNQFFFKIQSLTKNNVNAYLEYTLNWQWEYQKHPLHPITKSWDVVTGIIWATKPCTLRQTFGD